MNRSAKEQVYSNVYQSLKENQAISNLGYPEERKHYDFNCSVGPVKVSFRLNSQNDTYMIRGMLPCENGNNNEINDFINGLKEKEDCINAFVGDNHYVVISTSSTVAGLDDEEATKKIEKEAEAFFSFLVKNQDAITAYQSKGKDSIEGKSVDPKPKKKNENQKRGKTVGIPPVLANVVSGMQKPKEKIKEVEKKEDVLPVKMEETAKALSKESTKADESDLKEEKSAFRQYKKDQEHLLNVEKEKVSKQQEKLDKEMASLEAEKKVLSQEKAELSKSKDTLSREQKVLETEQSKFEKQLLGFKKEQAEFKKEKDSWDNTTLDERLVQRRKELEKSENNLYKKEEDFQTFQETTLSSIESRMEEADKKEKELIKKEEAFHVRDSKLKDAEMDIELRYKKLEDKERTAAKKEVELSDKEAAIRRTEIVKKDAENKLKQLEITEKNLTNRKEQLDMKESELQKRQEAFEKKYHQALEELASLDRKQEELKKKEAELRTLIGENEKLEEQLKELKDDTEETRKLLDTKDASIKEKEKVINNQKNTIKSLKETVTQTQQKNKALSEEKKSLQGKLNASDEKKSVLEDEIAKVRSDLYDTKEKLKSTKSSADKQNKNVTDNERLIAENEKLKAEMDKNSHSYQESMKEMNYDLDSSQRKITELESLLKKANMEVEELKKNPILSFDFDPDTIGAKEIVSERQGLYAATIDNCTIYIDTENQVLQFKKAVRRPAKYTKKILSWNEESINETYYITSSEVCCRKTCRHDITEEMQDVIERIRSLK